MPDRVTVTSAEFVRNIGAWQEQALKTPVSITYHGRERLVLLAAERYIPNAGASGVAGHGNSIVLDHMNQGYVELDDDLAVIAANPVAEAYFGLGRDELFGRQITDVFPVLQGSVFVEQIRRVMLTRITATFEADAFIFDGHRVAFTICPLAKGLGVLFQNLAQLDVLNATATRADAMLAGISGHRDIAIARFDVRGRFTSVDERFSGWAGFDRCALLNCRLVDLVTPLDRRLVSDAFDQVVTTGKGQALRARMVTRGLCEWTLSMSFAGVQSAHAKSEVWAVFTAIVANLENKAAAEATVPVSNSL